MKNKLTPFVKWAGGKTQLLPHLEELLPESYQTYYEPFIGGGALLLNLQPAKAVIGDVNEQLINIYKQIQMNVEDVIHEVNELDKLNCSVERYLSIRKYYNEKKIANHVLDAETAALMIWLNKHCFNGLYRTNSTGFFNVPWNKKEIGHSIVEENLRNIAEYLNTADITIQAKDFEETCKSAKPGDFIYFDSPYIPVSATASFTDYTKDGFTGKDHVRLAQLFKDISKKGILSMLSNHNVPLIYELYEGFHIEAVSVHRMINRDASKRTGKEVIITNYLIHGL